MSAPKTTTVDFGSFRWVFQTWDRVSVEDVVLHQMRASATAIQLGKSYDSRPTDRKLKDVLIHGGVL